MMIEQKLEKNVIDKIAQILHDNNIQDFEAYGSLQPNTVKGVEDESQIIIGVKTQPRSYSSPTTPTCQIDVAVVLTIRADVDFSGKNYLEVCDLLMGLFENWQKCLDDAHADFSISGEFSCAGFQLGSGATAVDPDKTVWQYTHNFTVYGVVKQ